MMIYVVYVQLFGLSAFVEITKFQFYVLVCHHAVETNARQKAAPYLIDCLVSVVWDFIL